MVNSRVFWGIVTAAAAGAVIGLLFAPDSGAQTRRRIRKSADDWSHDALDSLECGKDKVVEAAKRLKKAATEAKVDAKQALDDATV